MPPSAEQPKVPATRALLKAEKPIQIVLSTISKADRAAAPKRILLRPPVPVIISESKVSDLGNIWSFIECELGQTLSHYKIKEFHVSGYVVEYFGGKGSANIVFLITKLQARRKVL